MCHNSCTCMCRSLYQTSDCWQKLDSSTPGACCTSPKVVHVELGHKACLSFWSLHCSHDHLTFLPMSAPANLKTWFAIIGKRTASDELPVNPLLSFKSGAWNVKRSCMFEQTCIFKKSLHAQDQCRKRIWMYTWFHTSAILFPSRQKQLTAVLIKGLQTQQCQSNARFRPSAPCFWSSNTLGVHTGMSAGICPNFMVTLCKKEDEGMKACSKVNYLLLESYCVCVLDAHSRHTLTT